MFRSREGTDLAWIPVFSDCSRKELARIGRLADVVRVPAGTRLLDQGQLGHEFFVILEGRARVVRSGPTPSISTIGPCDHYGELALLGGGATDVSVVALTDMELAVFAQREFFSVLGEVPSFGRQLLGGMARQLREAAAPMDEPLAALG